MEQHEILSNRSLANQAMLQSNVRLVGVDVVDKQTLEFEFAGMLADVAWPLVTKFPHIEWVVRARKLNNSHRYRVTDLEAFKEGKEVGKVSTVYSRAYGSAFALYSETISEERERGSFLRTQKHDVVLATVRKKFNPRSVQKMFQEAEKSVFNILGTYTWTAERQRRDAKTSMVDDLFTRMEANPQIADHIAPFIRASDMLKYEQACFDMRSIEDLREMVQTSNKRTALVLLDRGGYIVRAEEQVAIYNDETLPMEMRKSLGLLKLIQNDEQFVPDVGVRVNDHTFLVLVDEA